MARLIGMDEAGLGPNFGPFVVAMTVWDVPRAPRKFDFWQTFADVLTNEPQENETRLHVADSKQVFQPQRGYAGLARGVLSALRLMGHSPQTLNELCQILSGAEFVPADEEQGAVPYPYDQSDLPLDTDDHDLSVAEAWRECCERNRIRLHAIKVAIIHPHRFNRLIQEYDNKSLLVSRVAFQLLRSIWNPDETETFVIGDKHGGRNRYDLLLSEVLDGDMIFRLEEGAEKSEYRVGKTVLRFQPRAEEYGPVALASMTAKYVRELAMVQFNRFWASHLDGLKPTAGYPNDAIRFREAIAETQRQLGIPDEILWRCR